TFGKAGDFGKESLDAVFRAENTRTGDIENSGSEDGEADQDEEPDAEFRPSELFSLRHLAFPPEDQFPISHRIQCKMPCTYVGPSTAGLPEPFKTAGLARNARPCATAQTRNRVK